MNDDEPVLEDGIPGDELPDETEPADEPDQEA